MFGTKKYESRFVAVAQTIPGTIPQTAVTAIVRIESRYSGKAVRSAK